MTYLVFADEQKKVAERWDYHALMFISKQKANYIYDYIQTLREKYNFYGEIKFSGLNTKGIGTTLQIVSDLLSLIYHEACSPEDPSLFFTITGIDRDNLDFSFFGDDDTPKGKYANVYNRFFRSSLKGAISLFFQERTCSEISYIIHDSEGNLENHGYFERHVINKASLAHKNIKFKSDRVVFINSDHNKEEVFPKCSHLVQLVDILLGAITHCIHYEHKKNKGKNKAAEIVAPLVDELLNPQPQYKCKYQTYRRYSISHFPKNKLQNFNGDYIPGEYYKLNTVRILEENSPQIELF